MPVDAVFDAAICQTLKHEGGLSDDPKDHGGLTCYGISQRAYPSEDIANLTLDRAKLLYFTDFWLRYRINQLPGVLIPAKVFDTAVLCGGHCAIKLLQEALNAVGETCDVDGAIGPKTVQACRSVSGPVLLAKYRALLGKHFQAIADNDPSQARFLSGWKNRALS